MKIRNHFMQKDSFYEKRKSINELIRFLIIIKLKLESHTVASIIVSKHVHQVRRHLSLI